MSSGSCRALLQHTDLENGQTERSVLSPGQAPGQALDRCWMGSSCQALRHAVAALHRLDDFVSVKIGAGFFSEVFKVTHKTTGQVMVLKMNMSQSNRPNMLREVQLMNKLSHPNILRFMGVCVHEGQLHALTEYINGGSLEQLLLNPAEDLSWVTRVKLAVNMSQGMRYLHWRGIFHRDLTSKNVLIKREDNGMTAVVGDFGLAEKIPDPLSKLRLPTVGSPYWMSPECLKGELYNEKGDVFSYGIILCEIIARIEADPDVLPRTENFGLDYIAFSEMCSDCPPDFLKLAFTCCMMDPKQRPSFASIVDCFEIILPSLQCSISSATDNIAGVGVRNEDVAATNYKMLHRRSKSEDTLLAPSTTFTSPSDKARCHLHTRPKSGSSMEGASHVTPKHIGQVMSLGDPYYRPGGGRNHNPFANMTQFRDGKKILASSRELFSSCFELPSPSSVMTAPHLLPREGRRKQLLRSNSLPTSAPQNAPSGDPVTYGLGGNGTAKSRGSAHRSSIGDSVRMAETPMTVVRDGHRRNQSDDNVMKSASPMNLLCVSLTPPGPFLPLTRRGSCESGFYSVGGDGDRVSTSDELSPELVFDDAASTASSTLSTFSSKCVPSPRSSCIENDDIGEGSDDVTREKEKERTFHASHDAVVPRRTSCSPLKQDELSSQL